MQFVINAVSRGAAPTSDRKRYKTPTRLECAIRTWVDAMARTNLKEQARIGRCPAGLAKCQPTDLAGQAEYGKPQSLKGCRSQYSALPALTPARPELDEHVAKCI